MKKKIIAMVCALSLCTTALTANAISVFASSSNSNTKATNSYTYTFKPTKVSGTTQGMLYSETVKYNMDCNKGVNTNYFMVVVPANSGKITFNAGSCLYNSNKATSTFKPNRVYVDNSGSFGTLTVSNLSYQKNHIFKGKPEGVFSTVKNSYYTCEFNSHADNISMSGRTATVYSETAFFNG